MADLNSIELNATARLIESRSALDRIRGIEKLFDDLKARRVPAVLNKVDHTIGFKYEMPNAVRALELMGFRKYRSTDNSVDMRSDTQDVRLAEPREGWFPVLTVL